MESLLTKKQTKKYGPKRYTNTYGEDADILVTVRYDDECGNGHNSFSITADIWRRTKKGISRMKTARDIDMGGCCHDDVVKAFPELASLIKWHLVSSDGPMHYIANTTYHAREGKLDYARSSAVWSMATDEDLKDSELDKVLATRLPSLMIEFRKAVESLGFIY